MMNKVILIPITVIVAAVIGIALNVRDVRSEGVIISARIAGYGLWLLSSMLKDEIVKDLQTRA